MRGRWFAAAMLLVVVACDGATDRSEAPPTPDHIRVASFDFVESRLLAEIYAQALEAGGFEVERQFELGPRELVTPALRQGFVDVVPEYAGSALDAVAPDSLADRHDVVEVVEALRETIRPWGVEALSPSPASNQNEIVVTADRARGHDLADVSDLAPLARSLTIGGPPECSVRQHCLVGLTDVYGLRFAAFVPLVGDELVRRALSDGVIDVGVLFSTDAVLADGDLVVLRDDRRLQPAENVVPIVRRPAVDDRAAAILDAVSGHLDRKSVV